MIFPIFFHLYLLSLSFSSTTLSLSENKKFCHLSLLVYIIIIRSHPVYSQLYINYLLLSASHFSLISYLTLLSTPCSTLLSSFPVLKKNYKLTFQFLLYLHFDAPPPDQLPISICAILLYNFLQWSSPDLLDYGLSMYLHTVLVIVFKSMSLFT